MQTYAHVSVIKSQKQLKILSMITVGIIKDMDFIIKWRKKKKELSTSLSRPAATVMMPPVLLLIVNILGDGLSGF